MAVTLANNKLEEYKCDANSALHIKLVTNEKDVFDQDKSFHPDMSHQVFGDSEVIFGYKNLEVQLYYHAGSLLTYLGVKYDGMVDKSFSEGVEPDDIISKVADFLAPGCCSNLDHYTVAEQTYQVYKADVTTPNFRKYHKRLQTFVLWYIDAASFLDMDDDRWDFFLMYKKFREAGTTTYSIVGYMTAYRYYAYPDMKRPRISQFLILPPFQKIGLG
ncbi:histone acetyltransferase type B catalytic subunit, partial [Paramuricea clavata]